MGVAQSTAGITRSITFFSVVHSYPMGVNLCYICESGRIAAALKEAGISGLYMYIVGGVVVHEQSYLQVGLWSFVKVGDGPLWITPQRHWQHWPAITRWVRLAARQ